MTKHGSCRSQKGGIFGVFWGIWLAKWAEFARLAGGFCRRRAARACRLGYSSELGEYPHLRATASASGVGVSTPGTLGLRCGFHYRGGSDRLAPVLRNCDTHKNKLRLDCRTTSLLPWGSIRNDAFAGYAYVFALGVRLRARAFGEMSRLPCLTIGRLDTCRPFESLIARYWNRTEFFVSCEAGTVLRSLRRGGDACPVAGRTLGPGPLHSRRPTVLVSRFTVTNSSPPSIMSPGVLKMATQATGCFELRLGAAVQSGNAPTH